MSKKMLIALAITQMNSLSAKDNKERLKFTIAGCKDGKLYDHAGTDYGVFDENAEDVIFIPDTDLQLSRITGAKISGITQKALAFFAQYAEAKPADDDGSDEDESEAGQDEDDTDEVDYAAVEKACKKAIKKGDLKKAKKLLAKLDGQDCHKKLSKKLDKAQS